VNRVRRGPQILSDCRRVWIRVHEKISPRPTRFWYRRTGRLATMTSDRGRDNGLSIGWLVGFGRRSISRQCDRVGRSSLFAADVTEVSVHCRSNLCRTMDSAERNTAPQGYSFVRLFLCHSVLWICSGNKSSDLFIYLLSYRCRPELKTNKL